jgi:hypothetical protein
MTFPSPFIGTVLAVVAGLHLSLAKAAELDTARLEAIRLSHDGKSFVLADSGAPFRIWGVNYDHDATGAHGRLLEDYWETEWDKVQHDFREIKALGANVVRIHLQFGKFMDGPETPNPRSLAQLHRLLGLAEETGLYLDLTGLACYHKAETPPWYDALGETARWNAQAHFWSALAQTCRDSKAVFCFDLMNEPIIEGKADDGWVTGELGGYSYVQRLTLTRGNRTPLEVAKAWVDRLTGAIRKEDPNRLITVGAIPWAMTWPTAKPVFYSPEVGGALDFVSIHVYPKKGGIDKALAAIRTYEIGKPVLIEETFPLESGIDEMDDFLKRSKPLTQGYIGFYWGTMSPEFATNAKLPEAAAFIGSWLKYFQQHADFMKQP